MTNQEYRDARAMLGASHSEIAKAFGVNIRTAQGWESGMRNGAPATIPLAIGILMRLACKNPTVRRELGFGKIAVRTPDGV